jgi:hypothetical protein
MPTIVPLAPLPLGSQNILQPCNIDLRQDLRVVFGAMT